MASYDVFTPTEVATKMRSYLPEHVDTLLEPSVGTGDLLRVMEGAYSHADVVDINPTYIASIPDSERLTKTCGDFLSMDISQTYDAILMNPPYLRFQAMPADMRARVRGMEVLRSGNVDLYLAFLVKCIQLLNATGTLVAIVPSTWLYNKSCAAFREWVFSQKLVHAIHDYGTKKVFPGINVYCCILVVNRLPKTSYMLNDTVVPFVQPQTDAPPTDYLQTTCDIQNGVATLCDSVFIHDAPLFAEPCWKPILKVSKQATKSILYPYDATGNILAEEEFRRANPQTYAYLERNRARLAMRDKGNKTYEAWYAFGRKQGLRIPESPESVYISTLCSPHLPTFRAPTALFYSGIRITPRTITCEAVQDSIEKHKSLLTNACSKRSNEWLNITTTSLRRLPVPKNQ